MCGIAGIIGVRPFESEHISRMNSLQSHRGPDGNGVHKLLEGHLWLGHQRLAIIDLSAAAHQPMSYADGRYWIVFNGEIYNHCRLRDELQQLGHCFKTRSDTEVVLAAYAAWGESCLERFEGMWGLLIFDNSLKRLFAARDRFGIKPLYYRRTNDSLAFSSEIKAFTELPDWQARMNRQRAYDFLVWGLIDHTAETLFEGVYQLRGGEAMHIDLHAIGHTEQLPQPMIWRWYELTADPTASTLSIDTAATKTLRLLEASVNDHLQADVSIGSCLSGGLDSSSIVCLMHKILQAKNNSGRQTAFSACTAERGLDERPYMAMVAEATNIGWHQVEPQSETLLEKIDHLVWHQDEPFATTSPYAQWEVFGLSARNGVKVMLDGQGADEVLAGYHGFFGPFLANLFVQGKLSTLANELKGMSQIHGYRKTVLLMRIADQLMPENIRNLMRRLSGYPHATPDWLDINKLGAAPIDPFKAAGGRAPSIQVLSFAQVQATNLPMLLHWEDRSAMAHSVEARVPFLNHQLVEFLLGLPDNCKVHEGTTKLALRTAMKGILPESVRTRQDKLGFVTPEATWARKRSGDFKVLLKRSIENSSGILRPRILDYFEQMVKGDIVYDSMVWRALVFGVWQSRFGIS